jgi:tetratricopeptide (TPR) repeat protein
MKLKSIYTIYMIGALLNMCIFQGCEDDFLEITPKGRIITQTTNDFDLALNNLSFVSVSPAFGEGAAQVAMGDEVLAYEPFFNGTAYRHQRLFRWEDVIYEPDEDAVEMGATMQNIYAYNSIINGVMDASEGTETEKRSIRAEAIAGRAWTYFLLINYFGLPYNEGTSGSDIGFPIVTNADITQTNFTRATVAEVYEFIVDDLNNAIPDLPVQTTSRVRMSRAAAEGLLGKVLVFMGRFQDAKEHLDNALALTDNGPLEIALYDYNQTFAPGGSFLPIGLFGPVYPIVTRNTENIYAKQFSNVWSFFSNDFVLTPETVSLFGPSDLRRNFYSNNAYAGGAFPNNLLRRIGPSASQYGVLVPDIYLLKMECEARLDNLGEAVTDLEHFRSHRMPTTDAEIPMSIANDQGALVRFILEERIREFAVQGFRWFDMRRLSVDPLYNDMVDYTHDIIDGNGNVIESFTLRPERFALRFPQKVINQNPEMENNP